jgi:hypothetical protein
LLGLVVGDTEGITVVGIYEGLKLGVRDGFEVVGVSVGLTLGESDGNTVGVKLGKAVVGA